MLIVSTDEADLVDTGHRHYSFSMSSYVLVSVTRGGAYLAVDPFGQTIFDSFFGVAWAT